MKRVQLKNSKIETLEKVNPNSKKIGYRQMTALINKSGEFKSFINHKRVYRIMKANKMLSNLDRETHIKLHLVLLMSIEHLIIYWIQILIVHMLIMCYVLTLHI